MGLALTVLAWAACIWLTTSVVLALYVLCKLWKEL